MLLYRTRPSPYVRFSYTFDYTFVSDTMADPFQARTLKRKNVKGLALSAPPARTPNPSDGDAQIPGAIGNTDSNRTDTLEIGLEFKLDLRSEDLIVLKELGAGNGGTVSKVMHASTKVVMARKVSLLQS